jgi:hypothetical protein
MCPFCALGTITATAITAGFEGGIGLCGHSRDDKPRNPQVPRIVISGAPMLFHVVQATARPMVSKVRWSSWRSAT